MKNLLWIIFFANPMVGHGQNHSLLIQSHLEKFSNAKKYTLSIAAKLAEDKYDFKPVKEEMSFKEQLVHIGENIFWLSSTYISEETNPIKADKNRASQMNKEQVLEFVLSAYDYAEKAITALDQNSLSKAFSWRDGKMNKFQFLNLIQDHQAHHVGQLIVYLRINGIEPPRYIGW